MYPVLEMLCTYPVYNFNSAVYTLSLYSQTGNFYTDGGRPTGEPWSMNSGLAPSGYLPSMQQGLCQYPPAAPYSLHPSGRENMVRSYIYILFEVTINSDNNYDEVLRNIVFENEFACVSLCRDTL